MPIALKAPRTPARTLLFLVFALMVPPLRAAQAASDAPTYDWVDLYACNKPLPLPPHSPRETDLVYNVERRYMDLELTGKCIVMDVWLGRFSSMPDSISRDLEQRWYRYTAKRWEKFSAYPIEYFPYALRSSDGQTFLIQAVMEIDVGDPVILRGNEKINLSILQINPGHKGLLGDDEYMFRPYSGNDAHAILNALAEKLTDRLASGQLVREELANISPDIRPQTERARIALILKAAEAAPK